MKRSIIIIVLLLVAIPSLCFAVSRGGGGGGGKKNSGEMSVQVRQSAVKSTPNYLGGSVGTVSYGQQVNVVGDEGNWYQIERPSGWVPKSALTKHSVAVNADQKGASAAGKRDEVALAGKGFNPQVEAQYK